MSPIALELGAGYLSILPDGSKFGPALQKEIGDDLERAGTDAGRRAGDGFGGTFGAGIKKAVGVAAAAFAGLQIVGVLKGSVEAASNLGETLSKSVQVFGDWSIDIEQFGDTAARTLGQTKQQAIDAASTFAIFGKSAGLSGGDLTDFSTSLVGLTADMASFSNTTPEEAIEAVGAALRGESEPIRRYGVLLDDATLRNRALALGLISSTKDALTPANKVLAAQAEILAQTSDVQGDFARTSGGLANQQRILNALLEDGKVKLGQALLPAVTAVVSYLVSTGIPAFQAFTGMIRDTVLPIVTTFISSLRSGLSGEGVTTEGWIGVAERIGSVIRVGLEDARIAINSFISGLSGEGVTTEGWIGVVELVGSVTRIAFEKLGEAAAGARDAVVATVGFIVDHQDGMTVAAAAIAGFAGSMGAIAAAQSAATTVSALSSSTSALAQLIPLVAAHPILLVVAAVVAAGVAAFAAYKKFKPFRDVVDSLIDPFQKLSNKVLLIGGALLLLNPLFGIVAAGLFLAFQKIEPFRNAVLAVVDVFSSLGQTVSGFATTVSSALSTAFGAVTSAASTATRAVIAALTPLVTWINDNLITTFFAAGEAVVAFVGFVVGVISPFVEVWIKILTPILDFMVGLFAGILGTVTEHLGLVFDIIGTVLGDVFDIIGGFIQTVLPAFETFGRNLFTIVEGAFNVIKSTIEGVLGVIRGVLQVFTGVFSGDWSKVWEGLNTIVSSVFGAVVGIFQGILDTINGIISNSLSGIGEVARNAAGDLGDALYQAGRDLIRGMISGVRSMAGALKDAVVDVVTSPVDLAKSVLGISSPSKVFMEIGMWSGEGLAIGLDKSRSMVDVEARGVVSGLVRSAIPADVAAAAPVPAPAFAGPGGGISIDMRGAHVYSEDVPDQVARRINEKLIRLQRSIR